MSLIRKGFAFAEMAHINQKRKAGDPYITHPLAVASIVCDELKLGVNPIIAALLHDVVEDTNHTIEEIKAGFGSDIAFLVDVLTKKKRDKYETSKQVDNFQQMLNSIHYDIRALLIKLADRLALRHPILPCGEKPDHGRPGYLGHRQHVGHHAGNPLLRRHRPGRRHRRRHE